MIIVKLMLDLCIIALVAMKGGSSSDNRVEWSVRTIQVFNHWTFLFALPRDELVPLRIMSTEHLTDCISSVLL